MAPEILEGKKYKGQVVDLFAIGIILFGMVVGKFPFSACAESNDELYALIKDNKAD